MSKVKFIVVDHDNRNIAGEVFDSFWDADHWIDSYLSIEEQDNAFIMEIRTKVISKV